MLNILQETFQLAQEEVSMESIAFQKNSQLASRLVAEFTTLKTKGVIRRKEIRESNLSKIVQEETGLLVEFDVTEDTNAWVFIPELTERHPFFNFYGGYSNEEGGRMVRQGPINIGVDLKRSKVYGTITTYKHSIVLGRPLMERGTSYTPEMVTAILLHEVGHLFSFYEYMARVASTNFLMTEFAEKLAGVKSEDVRIQIIRDAEHARNLSVRDKEFLANAKDIDEMRMILLKSETDRSVTELGNNIYDLRSWEALADTFAARHGMAEHQGLALHKMHAEYGVGMSSPWIVDLIMSVMGFLVSVFFFPIFLLNLLCMGIGVYFAEVYDLPQTRIKVLRKHLVERLKETSDAGEKKSLLISIGNLDNCIKEMSDTSGTNLVYNFIAKSIFPASRAAYRSINTQKYLEDFRASELEVAAARLEQGA